VVQVRGRRKLICVKGSSRLRLGKAIVKFELQRHKPECPYLTSKIFLFILNEDHQHSYILKRKEKVQDFDINIAHNIKQRKNMHHLLQQIGVYWEFIM